MLRKLIKVAGRARQVPHDQAAHARLTAERWGLSLRPPDGPRRGRILAYHSVGTRAWGINDVSPARFEQHLQIAVDDGWTFATTDDVLAAPDLPRLAITFDDGLASVLHNAIPVLRHHGIPATMFVVTGWADGDHPDGHRDVLDWRGVDALRNSGVRIANHSVSHPDFGRLPVGEIRRELEVSRHRLHQAGIDSDEFAIPFGQSRNWPASAAAIAAEVGFTHVYAQAVETRPPDTIPRTFVTRVDRPRLFRAALAGAYDRWEEWF
jgi:peptidoglycan/xylan/chitin deacetylase (PgdA/CDA1 family)